MFHRNTLHLNLKTHFFHFSFHATLLTFFPYECPGLCQQGQHSTIGILVGEKRINKEHPIKDVLV